MDDVRWAVHESKDANNRRAHKPRVFTNDQEVVICICGAMLRDWDVINPSEDFTDDIEPCRQCVADSDILVNREVDYDAEINNPVKFPSISSARGVVHEIEMEREDEPGVVTLCGKTIMKPRKDVEIDDKCKNCIRIKKIREIKNGE